MSGLALSAQFFIQMNARLTERFGGVHGVRSESGLLSAMGRYDSVLHYVGDDHIQASIAVCEGIVRNHPFVDGNKRTGLAALHVCLGMQGMMLEADDMDMVNMMEGLASRAVSIDEFTAWVNSHTVDREAYLELARRDTEVNKEAEAPEPTDDDEPSPFSLR